MPSRDGGRSPGWPARWMLLIGILGVPYMLFRVVRDRWRKWRGHPDGPGTPEA